MPRSLRIEYPGAIYHVINRGNYRDSVFFSDTVKSIFENTLFAAWGYQGTPYLFFIAIVSARD